MRVGGAEKVTELTKRVRMTDNETKECVLCVREREQNRVRMQNLKEISELRKFKKITNKKRRETHLYNITNGLIRNKETQSVSIRFY